MENLIIAFEVLILSVMVGVILLQVIMRYLPVSINFPWTEEIARFTNIWLAFIGGAHLLDGHISVDALVQRLSPKVQKYVFVFSNIIQCCFYGIVFWCATLMSILESDKVSPAAGINMTFFYLPLAICSIILLVYHGIHIFKMKKSKEVTKEC